MNMLTDDRNYSLFNIPFLARSNHRYRACSLEYELLHNIVIICLYIYVLLLFVLIYVR